MPLLFSRALRNEGIDLKQFVALSTTNPAKIYGLYPQKGTIEVGSDADLAVWDPELETTISIDHLHDGMDYTPYEGLSVTGWPVLTISRGEIIWRDGEIAAEPGRGRFLPCARPLQARDGDLFQS